MFLLKLLVERMNASSRKYFGTNVVIANGVWWSIFVIQRVKGEIVTLFKSMHTNTVKVVAAMCPLPGFPQAANWCAKLVSFVWCMWMESSNENSSQTLLVLNDDCDAFVKSACSRMHIKLYKFELKRKYLYTLQNIRSSIHVVHILYINGYCVALWMFQKGVCGHCLSSSKALYLMNFFCRWHNCSQSAVLIGICLRLWFKCLTSVHLGLTSYLIVPFACISVVWVKMDNFAYLMILFLD